MSEVLKIRLAARCEAAGRTENEDNYQVAENLSVSNAGFITDKVFTLGNKGTLLLVCDGMGGMNAGEVASAIGVETIKNLFAPQLLTNDIFSSDDSVCMYLKRAIIKADSRIKEEANKDDAKRGMGSTAVVAWLLGQKVYVAWCGDSRCYRYNPASGLEQLSHDHSYVQDLVDTGQLSADLAFDHPNKNIITRSLGDPRGAAKPDAKVYDLHKGDIIMLCSDGLSDSLRDSEIEQSIGRSIASMESCRDALWNDSKQAGWHDNVTIVLAQVLDEKIIKSEPLTKPKVEVLVPSAPPQDPNVSKTSNPVCDVPSQYPEKENGKRKLNLKVIVSIVSIVALMVILALLISKISLHSSVKDVEENIKQSILPQEREIPKTMESDILNELDKLNKNNKDSVILFAIKAIDQKWCTIYTSTLDSLSEKEKDERRVKLEAILDLLLFRYYSNDEDERRGKFEAIIDEIKIKMKEQ